MNRGCGLLRRLGAQIQLIQAPVPVLRARKAIFQKNGYILIQRRRRQFIMPPNSHSFLEFLHGLVWDDKDGRRSGSIETLARVPGKDARNVSGRADRLRRLHFSQFFRRGVFAILIRFLIVRAISCNVGRCRIHSRSVQTSICGPFLNRFSIQGMFGNMSCKDPPHARFRRKTSMAITRWHRVSWLLNSFVAFFCHTNIAK